MTTKEEDMAVQVPTESQLRQVAAEIGLSLSDADVTSFIDLMRPFGILEMVRTGRIAMLRGESMSKDLLVPADRTDAVESTK